MELFPCVPKSGRIHKTSTHLDRVAIGVEQRHNRVPANDDAAVAATPAGDAAVATKTTYYINPEDKQSEDKTDASTEQDAPEKRVWNWSGDKPLYPFWAVDRKSADWVRKDEQRARAHAEDRGD